MCKNQIYFNSIDTEVSIIHMYNIKFSANIYYKIAYNFSA